MSSPDWQELERLWQSSSEAAQAKDLIIRMHGRAWLRYLIISLEILLLCIGLGLCTFLILRDQPGMRLRASVLLVAFLSAGGLSLWARLAPKVSSEQSVTTALDTAIHRARVRVRLALATLWAIGIGLFITTFYAVVWAQSDTYATSRVHLQIIAFACGWSGLWQVLTIPTYLRRMRELQRLEDIKQGLKDTL